MFVDAGTVADGRAVDCDVCIVGAGPAGITVARHLRFASDLRVVVLESGGLDDDGGAQDLNEGSSVGRPLTMGGIELGPVGTRLRGLGGTSRHWNGMCRPLDPSDLLARSWIGAPGWPLSFEEVAGWYGPAAELCELIDGPWALTDVDAAAPRFAGLDPVLYRFSTPTRFGDRWRGDLAAAPLVEVHAGATALSLQTTPDGTRVARVAAATRDGRRYDVVPRAVVVAVGGMETARLLLGSDDVHRDGLGNGSDLVGRGFVDHPHVVVGSAVLDRDLVAVLGAASRPGPGGGPSIGALAASRDLQASLDLAAMAVTFELLETDDDEQAGSGGDHDDPADDELTSVGGISADDIGRAHRILGLGPGLEALQTVHLVVRAEQRPNDDSRVRLGRSLDALGQRRLEVDWRPGADDTAGIGRFADHVAAEIGASGRGRVRLLLDDLEDRIECGSHHIGTARMSSAPSQGVVDPDGRLHDVANVWVAGSATWPPGSGYANPTFTIVALALRLADHLALRRPW